jgi:integrase
LTEAGKAVIKAPKSKASKRIVTMPEWYMQELKEYHHESKVNRIKAGEKWEGADRQYVFQVGFGKAIYHSTPTHWWKKFTVRHGLKFVRLHDLRHSAATILIQNDVSMKAIQERLGHSKHQTTADLYAHVAQSVSRAAADKLEKLDPRKISPSTIRQQL